MLRGVAARLEQHHGVTIPEGAVRDAVALSHRYLPERQLPDKAISVLDTACARVALGQHDTPPPGGGVRAGASPRSRRSWRACAAKARPASRTESGLPPWPRNGRKWAPALPRWRCAGKRNAWPCTRSCACASESPRPMHRKTTRTGRAA
ncbi:hypothetical protein [Massilia sp. Se16.2.3]|uniref:hypothetical protein n=1 Tax=Massilia sp. Se16.2.3 TaxID=2709303 RepID=UPI00191CB59A|nr:hypothetical protein [Massilia sp. Se16.2.3]